MVILGIGILFFLGLLIYLPTPAEALLRYVPKKSMQATPYPKPPYELKSAPHKPLTQEISLTSSEALVLINFIQDDVLSSPNRDICAMLASAYGTEFFKEGFDFNAAMWEGVQIGRAANTDPMVELVLQGLSYYRRFSQIKTLLQMIQLEFKRGEIDHLTKLRDKTEVLRLSWSLTASMNKPEQQAALRLHTKSLEPIGLLIQFLHEHPQFATDPDFINFCYKPSPEEWTKLLTHKGHSDWKPAKIN